MSPRSHAADPWSSTLASWHGERHYHRRSGPAGRFDHEVDTMDEQAVRARAQAMCDALAAGDVERATADFSPELRRNLGEVLALMPLPANEVVIDSIEHGGSGYNVVLRIAGEVDEVQLQTRWKDRDGEPRMVEASHLASTAIAPADDATDEIGDEPGEGA
jgi:hypothetical protein